MLWQDIHWNQMTLSYWHFLSHIRCQTEYRALKHLRELRHSKDVPPFHPRICSYCQITTIWLHQICGAPKITIHLVAQSTHLTLQAMPPSWLSKSMLPKNSKLVYSKTFLHLQRVHSSWCNQPLTTIKKIHNSSIILVCLLSVSILPYRTCRSKHLWTLQISTVAKLIKDSGDIRQKTQSAVSGKNSHLTGWSSWATSWPTLQTVWWYWIWCWEILQVVGQPRGVSRHTSNQITIKTESQKLLILVDKFGLARHPWGHCIFMSTGTKSHLRTEKQQSTNLLNYGLEWSLGRHTQTKQDMSSACR